MNAKEPNLDPMTHLRLEARLSIKDQIRHMLGQLRSLASTLKHQGHVEDEEATFNALLKDFSKAVSEEVGKITDAETASRLLDPFDIKWDDK